MHRILATNSFLFKIKEVNSKMCTFYHREEEKIEHVLWECDNVQSFLDKFERHVFGKTNFQYPLLKNPH
jgi:hypothetical protein